MSSEPEKSNGIKANMLFQGLYQIMVLGVPLIVSPYLTRTLGAENLGIYGYTNSIAYYFWIIAMLGISRHGQRVIAVASENQERLRKVFWSLFIDHVIISIIAMTAYLVFVQLFIHENTEIFMIQGWYVLSALFDVTWLFSGLERFKTVAIKNMFIKIVNMFLVFGFVRTSNDLVNYSLIMTFSTLVGNIIMLPQTIRIVPVCRITWTDLKEHIKPLFVLSISVIAVSLYVVFDKTLIGMFLDMSAVSYYEYADRLIVVPKSLLTVISAVLFPRFCKMMNQGETKIAKEYFELAFIIVAILGIGATFGLAAVSETFAPLYYGAEFTISGSIMKYLAPVIVIVALGDLIRTQLMISKNRDIQFILCVVINSIVNLILTCLLIRPLGVYGAVVGTLAAEICGLSIETYICRKEVNMKKLYSRIIPYCAFGLLMYGAVFLIQRLLPLTWRTLLIEFACGAFLYCGMVVWYVVKRERKIINIVKGVLG